MADFIHLRVHSGYSLLEGGIKVKDLLDLCKENEMPALAITDTSNLFCGVEFSVYASKDGIQPILGCQIRVKKKKKTIYDNDNEEAAEIVFLVQNEKGYQNLIKMISRSYLYLKETDLYPYIFFEDLEETSEGLIVLSGGVKGILGQSLLKRDLDTARVDALKFKEIYGDRFYIELMRHGEADEITLEPMFLDIAYNNDIPLVATNEVFFKDRDFYEASDALICIAGKRLVIEEDRPKLTEEHYFKTSAEMKALFSDLPEAIENTVKIAQRCGYMVEKRSVMFPIYTAPDMRGRTESEVMTTRSERGLKERLAINKIEDEEQVKVYQDRLDYELGIIKQMGFCGYFLIVSDFIMYSKNNGIPVGPGRGSGAGSLVAWCLGITDIDPLKFGLLFERFLNPERVSMPDFDVDFCQEKRELAIKYVQDKYGYEKVAQIITYGKLQAKAVIRDVGRVLQIPFPVVDDFAKKIPMKNPENANKPVTLKMAVDLEPELQTMISESRQVKKMYDISRKLEGLYRNASTHAAGVVIGPKPLDEILPLYKDVKSPTPVTQFDMKWVEDVGLIKFDFLGLKTLTVIDKAVKLIEKTHGKYIDISNIPLDCKEAYELLHKAHTAGVFQLESAGMRDVLRQLKPDTIEEITAVVALYRPGPMGNIPTYINRKFGKEEVESIHPKLDNLLNETYGIIVYQEQVMEIPKILADYSLGGADLLRRAMGKKKADEMAAQRKVFTAGCSKNGISEEKSTEIFDLMEKFASYGFNKSHAAAYAVISYRTAYLKALYPVEFMAATMTLDINNTDKLAEFKQEIESMGIEILPPDVNKSQVEFDVEDGKIRYALGAIKNAGSVAMQSIIDEREKNGPYTSIDDFVSRYDPHIVNKKGLENLVKGGGLDSLYKNRNRLYASILQIIDTGNKAREDRDTQQINLFGNDRAATKLILPELDDWREVERLGKEQEALGFYLSSHPLDGMERALKKLEVVPLVELDDKVKKQGSGQYLVSGMVGSIKTKISKNGNKFFIISLSDKTMTKDFFCFGESFERNRGILESQRALLFSLKGEKQTEGDGVRYNIQRVQDLEEKKQSLQTEYEITLQEEAPPTVAADLKKILDEMSQKTSGRASEVYILTQQKGHNVTISLGKYKIDKELRYSITLINGVKSVEEG